mgnify:CR=1 FL=1
MAAAEIHTVQGDSLVERQIATDSQGVLIQPAVDVTGRSVAEPIRLVPIRSALAVTVALVIPPGLHQVITVVALAAHVLPVVALVAHVLPVAVLAADTLLAVAVATLVEVEGKE